VRDTSGWSIRDKTCIVTGSTSGIGRETAKALCEQGARIVLVGRNASRLDALSAELRASSQDRLVHAIAGDFNSLEAVAGIARSFLSLGFPLHVLINNAGTFTYGRERTADGYERMFGVNHLAPFLLTSLLLPRLAASAPSRIINVSSVAYAFTRGLHAEDLMFERGFSPFRAYAHSKLATMLFTTSLHDRLQGADVAVCSLHPGFVATNLGAQNGWLGRISSALLAPLFSTAEEGARTSIHAATVEDAASIAGQYLVNGRVRRPRASAVDRDAAELLWRRSEDYVAPFRKDIASCPTVSLHVTTPAG